MVRTDSPPDASQFVGDMTECPGCGELTTSLRAATAAGPGALELCDDCLTTRRAERQRDRQIAGRHGEPP